MANSNAPFGFRPIRELSGAAYNGKFEYCFVPAAVASNIFSGDLVILLTGGSDSVYGYPSVTPSVTPATDVLLGACVGVDPALGGQTPNLNISYHPASTAGYIMVSTDPNLIYEAQFSAAFAAANLGKNANHLNAAGNVAQGTSGYTINTTGVAVTATLALRLKSMSTRTNNVIGNFTIVECMINRHQYANQVLGV